MLLTVRELEIRRVPFEVSFAKGAFDLSGTKFRLKSTLKVRGFAELTGSTDEILVSGRIAGTLEGECDRCLAVAPLELDREFELSYLPASMDSTEADLALEAADGDTGYYEGEGVELQDVLMEQILLWLPMHWTCREECQGICPVCGANRNETDCGCEEQRTDDRWAALRSYRPADQK